MTSFKEDDDDLLAPPDRMEGFPPVDFSSANSHFNHHFLGSDAAGIWSYGADNSSLPNQNGLDFQNQGFVANNGLFTNDSGVDWNTIADNMWAYNEMENGMGASGATTSISGNPIDVMSEEGMYAYAEALSRFLENSGSSLVQDVEADCTAERKAEEMEHPLYDPFRSVPFSNDSFDHLMSPSPSQAKPHEQEESSDAPSPTEKQSTDARPTFADMAKKAKRNPSDLVRSETGSSISKEGSVYESQESLSSTGKARSNSASESTAPAPVFRPARVCYAAARYMPLLITTDSKYGLDDFTLPEEEEIQTGTKETKVEEQGAASGDTVQTSSAKAEPRPVPRHMVPNFSRSRSEPGSVKLSSSSPPTVLNNKFRVANGSKSSSKRSHADYINNILSTGNTETPSPSKTHPKDKQTNADRDSKPSHEANGRAVNGKVLNGHANGMTSNGQAHGGSTRSGSHRPTATIGDRTRNKSTTEERSLDGNGITVRALLVVSTGKWLAVKLIENFLICLALIGSFTLQLVSVIFTQIYTMLIQAFRYLAVKVGYSTAQASPDSDFLSDYPLPNIGLETNIKLPESADEAVQRLLACGDSDAYTIMGLRIHCTDEEIRRYYRRQAVFVHPDKNQHEGAEEAFKILGQAFDFIGEPTKRAVYDKKLQEELLTEGFRREFSDLLSQFKEKLEEQRKWVHCNICNENHRRYITSRPLGQARKCSRCATHHPAKEGEIWAETTYLGFKWHFYGCMDDTIYEITPWVQCQPTLVNKFIPNCHSVQFRLSLGENNNSQNNARQSANRYNAPNRNSSTRYSNLPEADTLFQKYFNQSASNMSSDGHNVPPSAKRNKRRGRKR